MSVSSAAKIMNILQTNKNKETFLAHHAFFLHDHVCCSHDCKLIIIIHMGRINDQHRHIYQQHRISHDCTPSDSILKRKRWLERIIQDNFCNFAAVNK